MARILIVDDDRPVLQSLELVLGNEGHELVLTQDGQQALQVLTDEPVDLVITDLLMKPVDGLELLRYVRKERPRVAVIVVSAYSSTPIIEQCRALGCAAYIRKPFRIREITETVRIALARQAPPPA